MLETVTCLFVVYDRSDFRRSLSNDKSTGHSFWLLPVQKRVTISIYGKRSYTPWLFWGGVTVPYPANAELLLGVLPLPHLRTPWPRLTTTTMTRPPLLKTTTTTNELRSREKEDWGHRPFFIRMFLFFYGKSFFLYVFLYTNLWFILYLGFTYVSNTRGGLSCSENGPKRHQTRRLRPWWVFLFFLSFSSVTN